MGYCSDRNIEVTENHNYISYAFHDDMVFVYFETYDDETPMEILGNKIKIDLKEFPTGERWIQMTDIFHYSYPVNEEYWKRKEKDKYTTYRIAYLRYEEIPKYIYYHYKGQQTYAYRHEKYGAIFMYRNMLIIYDEFPLEKTQYELMAEKWSDENILSEYNGDIIADVSIEGKGWEPCDR